MLFTRDDAPKGCVVSYLKWAKSEKHALEYIIKNKVADNGFVTFKKGGTGRLISVEMERE
jgi:hypothetical protein